MNFPLTHHWYAEIKKGRKTCEYRVASHYWVKRISKLNKGDTITFSKGYSKERIRAVVGSIELLSTGQMMKRDVKALLFLGIDEPWFYAISFTKKRSKVVK